MPGLLNELIHKQEFTSPAALTTFQSVIQGTVIDGSRITIWGYTTAEDIDVRIKVLVKDTVLQHPDFPTKTLSPGTVLVLTTEDIFESDVIVEFDTKATGPDLVVIKAFRSWR